MLGGELTLVSHSSRGTELITNLLIRMRVAVRRVTYTTARALSSEYVLYTIDIRA